jgi:ligand-binding SRPBCC domain-containing protein
MAKLQYEIYINSPVRDVYEYYTNPNNIQEAWPRDIVKESEDVSGSKNEEGSNEGKRSIHGKRRINAIAGK